MSSKSVTRMSIDIPTKDHKRLKMLANSKGLSLREFVLFLIDPVIHPEKKPNCETVKAMEEARKGKTIKAKDLQDLWKKLDI